MQLVRGRVARVGAMTRAVVEDEVDRPPVAIDLDAALLGHGDVELTGLPGVGEENVRPAGGGDLPDVEGQIVEAVIEHARLDLAFRATRQHPQRQLPEPLVRLRDRDLDHVEGGAGRQKRQQGHRPQRPVDAHAASLQGDRFPVGGHAAEPHQDAQKQRHRNGKTQALRHEHQHQAGDRGAVDSFRDELLGPGHEGRQHQHEGQDQQREEERRYDLAQDVAVRDPQHGTHGVESNRDGPSAATSFQALRRTRLPAAGRSGSGASDKGCYVNFGHFGGPYSRLPRHRVRSVTRPSDADRAAAGRAAGRFAKGCGGSRDRSQDCCGSDGTRGRRSGRMPAPTVGSGASSSSPRRRCRMPSSVSINWSRGT